MVKLPDLENTTSNDVEKFERESQDDTNKYPYLETDLQKLD
jgi:hypothetical protein